MVDRKWEDAIQEPLRVDPVKVMSKVASSNRRCTHISRTVRMSAASESRIGTRPLLGSSVDLLSSGCSSGSREPCSLSSVRSCLVGGVSSFSAFELRLRFLGAPLRGGCGGWSGCLSVESWAAVERVARAMASRGLGTIDAARRIRRAGGWRRGGAGDQTRCSTRPVADFSRVVGAGQRQALFSSGPADIAKLQFSHSDCTTYSTFILRYSRLSRALIAASALSVIRPASEESVRRSLSV